MDEGVSECASGLPAWTTQQLNEATIGAERIQRGIALEVQLKMRVETRFVVLEQSKRRVSLTDRGEPPGQVDGIV
jgi:hypothetical protein